MNAATESSEYHAGDESIRNALFGLGRGSTMTGGFQRSTLNGLKRTYYITRKVSAADAEYKTVVK